MAARSIDALRLENAFLRVLLDTVQAGIVACDADGVLTWFNSTARAFHGLPEEPLPPEQWARHYSLYHPDGTTPLAVEEIPLFRALRGETVRDVEMMIVPRGAPARVLLASGQAIVDTEGHTLGAVVAMYDITARKEAEVALMASEAKYRAIFENVQDVFYQTDLAGALVEISPSCFRYSGYTREELIGRAVQSLYANPADRERFLQQLQSEGEVTDCEVQLMHREGRMVYTSVSAHYRRGPGGEFLGVEGSLRDVTVRRQAERALDRERRQLREVVRSAPVAMALLDTEMRYLAHSGRWLEEYGLQEQELIGRPHVEVLGDLPARWTALYRRALAGEAIADHEDLWERADGSRNHLRLAINPWYDAEHVVGGMVIASVEIGDLVTAREAALETARLKSEFLALVSHEVRTPMSGIIGMTELLLETALTQEQREYARIVQESGAALLTMIDDILDFSKMEAGKLTLETIDVALADLVQSATELIAPRARAKGLRLTTVISPAIPSVLRGDPGRLRQVVLNLLSNALKFTQRGEIRVSATLREETPTGVLVHIAVTDTGIGLSEASCRRIFQPFVQADGSTTRHYGGTGLGLSISKTLVELMGGEIGVESVEGQGSTFWVTAHLGRPPSVGAGEGAFTPQNGPVLDLRVLEEIVEMQADGDAGLLAAVIALYEAEMPALLREIDAALAIGDGPAVAALAHRIKGSSAGLGASGMAQLSQEVETRARQGLPPRAETGARLAREYARARAALARYRDQEGAG